MSAHPRGFVTNGSFDLAEVTGIKIPAELALLLSNAGQFTQNQTPFVTAIAGHPNLLPAPEVVSGVVQPSYARAKRLHAERGWTTKEQPRAQYKEMLDAGAFDVRVERVRQDSATRLEWQQRALKQDVDNGFFDFRPESKQR